MLYKQILSKIYLIAFIIFLTMTPSIHAEESSGFTWTNIKKALAYMDKLPDDIDKKLNEIDKELTKRVKDLQIETYMESFSNAVAPFGTAAGQSEKQLTKITRTTTKEVSSKIGKQLLMFTDKVSKHAQIAGSLSADRPDWEGAVQALYDDTMSGAFAYAGGAIVTFFVGSNPIGWGFGAVGGALIYMNTLEPEAHKAFDQIAIQHMDDKEVEDNKIRRERVDYTNKVKKDRIKSCKEEIRRYRETNKRPPAIMYNICKKHGIDIYDLCPDNPNKTEPGICGCEKPDIDSDGDRVYTCNGDECDDNPKLTKRGKYGKDGCQTKEDWREEQLEGKHCPQNSFPKWNSKTNKPGCVCIKGMKPDKSLGICVDKNEDKTILTCKDIEGAQIISIPGYPNGCDCKKPLVWSDNKKQKCVTCNERNPGTIWNPNTNKCDKKVIQKLTVPSIMNLNTAGAQGVLQKRGLNLGTLKWGKQATSKDQVGMIVKQQPVRGQPINPGGKVDAWIYYTVVPAVVGKFVKDAIPAMNAAWFRPSKGREIEIENKYQWNTIASQSLNAGENKQNVGIPVTLDVYIKPKKKKTVSHPLIGRWEGYIKQGKTPKRTFYWEIRSVNGDGKFYGVSGAKGKTIKQNGIIKGTKINATSIEHYDGSIYKNVLNATLNKQNMTIKGNVTPYMDNKNMLPQGFRIIVYLKKKQQ